MLIAHESCRPDPIDVYQPNRGKKTGALGRLSFQLETGSGISFQLMVIQKICDDCISR
jgi:hypothetical protein